MAKQEHLIEYEKEALKELEELGKIIGRSPSVYEQIRRLLGHSDNGIKGIKIGATRSEGIPKEENVSWEKYVKIILGQLGGKRKKNEVLDYALKANPGIAPELVGNAISGKLSKLKINEEIGADENPIKSIGNEYYLLNESDGK